MKTQAEIQVQPPGETVEESPFGGLLGSPILLFGGMILLMWALLIRPQQRQQKQHKAMLAKIEKGDQIVTSGGIYGRVTGVTDDILTIEIAPRTNVKLSRSNIQSRVVREESKS